jgi:mannose-6-phosphate isomerase-like protein (cupin superfamily)
MASYVRCSAGFLLVVCLLACGCLTERQRAQMLRQPTNRVFQPDEVQPLGPDETHLFGEFDAGGSQNTCLLQLDSEAKLTKRFHKEHDLTLLAASGSAIVIVEETRYFVTPGSAVILPRYTAYSILPHRSEDDFVALMVFSPPYEGEDVVLLEE